MYSGRLGDQYTCLVAQTLAPKKHFSSFHFSFWNSLEYKNVERREKQWDKKVEKKEETVNESAFTYITT